MTIEIRTSRSGHHYFMEDGKRLPSPSTVCNRFKESGGLLYWANQQGLAGLTLDEAQKGAMTPGTIVHDRVECDIRGHKFDAERWTYRINDEGLDVDEVMTLANASWNAYRDWKEMSKMKTISAEISLVSEKYHFGGTMDAVGVTSGLYLIDWKTGALYPDHLLQIAGYVILWEENFPDRALDGVMLLSISKEGSGFTQRVVPRDTMAVPVRQFLRLLDAFKDDKVIKNLMK